jgi:hypothetical protein
VQLLFDNCLGLTRQDDSHVKPARAEPKALVTRLGNKAFTFYQDHNIPAFIACCSLSSFKANLPSDFSRLLLLGPLLLPVPASALGPIGVHQELFLDTMSHSLHPQYAAAVQCSSRCRHVMRVTSVTATQVMSPKLTSGSKLWPSQHRHQQQLNLSVSRSRLVACQAGPTQPLPVPEATHDFSPHVDSTVLGSQLLVLAVTIGAAAYWWWSVVPSARHTLAKEKRKGPLNEYLVELQQNPDRGVERWFYTDWLRQLQRRQQLAAQAAAKRAAAATNSAATSTSAAPQTGQQQATATPGVAADDVPAKAEQLPQQQQHQQQLPPQEEQYVDKEPYFWSLDNPLLATAAMLAVIGLVSTLLHGTP